MDKPAVGLLIGVKPKGEAEGEDEPGMEAKKAAAESLMAALKGDDPMAVVDAWESMQSCCGMESDD